MHALGALPWAVVLVILVVLIAAVLALLVGGWDVVMQVAFLRELRIVVLLHAVGRREDLRGKRWEGGGRQGDGREEAGG